MASPVRQLEGWLGRGYWVWALIPLIVLLTFSRPPAHGIFLHFGFLAQIMLGVWMARRFGRQGLAAFAVGCLLTSVVILYTSSAFGTPASKFGIGRSASRNLVAVFVAWLAADDNTSPVDSILDRAGVIRQWAVFCLFLTLGLIYLHLFVSVLPFDPAEMRPRLTLISNFHGATILTFLTLMLGLAGAGRRLFTALLLVTALFLVGDVVHTEVCAQDVRPALPWGTLTCATSGWGIRASPTLVNLRRETYYFSADLAMEAERTLLQLGGMVAAYAIGIYVRCLRRGEEVHHALFHAPVKAGLVLLILGTGFGRRYSTLPINDSFDLFFAGSYPLMLIGAFLLGSRLGYRGIALAAAVYLVAAHVPALIDWHPSSKPFQLRLSIGHLFDCSLAALFGTAIKYRYHVSPDAPRRFETATLFAALWTLLLGFVDLQSETGLIWLMASTLAAALIVLAIRFGEERARVAGVTVTRLTDILIVLAVLVFVTDHVPSIVQAVSNVGESLRTFAARTELTAFEAMLLGAQRIPIQAWLMLLFLLLLLDVFVLYSRLRSMARELMTLMRTLLRRTSGRDSEQATTTPDGV